MTEPAEIQPVSSPAPPLGRKTIRNVSVVYTMTALGKGMGIVSLLVLARLLTPAEFGIAALANLMVAILALFKDFGLSAALIQWKDSPPSAADSAFWGTMGMRGGLYAILLVLTPLVASFFSTPALLMIIPVAGLGLVIEGIGYTHASLLQKKLDFWRLSLIDATIIGAGAVITIILALFRFSYWSLVLGSLAIMPLQVALCWTFEPWRPSLRAGRQELRRMARYGTHIVFINSAGFGVGNLDSFSVGKIVGSIGLGFYQMAGRFGLFSATTISSPLARVLFPTYARIQNETERVRKAYLRTLFPVSLVAFPACAACLVMPDLISLYLLGPGWEAVALPLQILGLAGLAATISGPAWNVFLALGRPGYGSRTVLVELAILAALIVPATWYGGLAGAALAVMTTNAVGAIYQLNRVGGLLGLRRNDVILAVGPGAVGSLAMGILLAAMRSFIGTSLVAFLALVLVGIASFVLVSHIASSGRFLSELREVVHALRRQRA